MKLTRYILSLCFLNLFLVVQAQDEVMMYTLSELDLLKRYNKGYEVPVVDLLMHPNNEAKPAEVLAFKEKLNEKISRYKKLQERGLREEQLLGRLFFETHRKLLKNYREYSVVSDIVADGDYDCVSGTALYAVLLNALEFDYSIKETDHHLYIIVYGERQDYLFESTDALSGFVSDPEEIQERKLMYLQNETAENDLDYYSVEDGKVRNIGLDNLAGLQYYNLAVNAYNERQFDQSFNYLQKSLLLYSAPRIKKFYNLLIETVSFANLTSQANK